MAGLSRAPRAPARRILITGLATFWGGRLARHLEGLDDVEVIVGLDTKEPTVPLDRTEFVRTDHSYTALRRIVTATQIDTILHTHLIVDSTLVSSRAVHEVNVIGTMNLLAAAAAAPSVRKVIVKSSNYIYGSDRRDPYYFREHHTRSSEAKTVVESSLLETEDYVRDFVRDAPHVVTTILRFANVVGGELGTPLTRLWELPVFPQILGFDPRMQFVHTTDIVGALDFAVEHDAPGVFNVAGDGIIPWSEIGTRLRRPPLFISPVGTGLHAAVLGRLGVSFPPEVASLLRFGRGVDNRRYKAAGFRYGHTSAGAVLAHIEEMRVRRVKGNEDSYRYAGDVEEFLRRSSAVVNAAPLLAD